jgi:hypothetical protein
MKRDFDRILINGCSHSAGSEIEASGIGDGKYNRENCFGAQLARILKVGKINLAQPGGSNDYIANSTLLWCLSNPNLVKNTFFLIHWTSAERTDFYTNSYDSPKMQDWAFDTNFGHVHPEYHCPYFPSEDLRYVKQLTKYLFISETHWEINRLMNIIKTQTLLTSLGAKFAFYNAFDPLIKSKRYQKYHQLIDHTKYYKPFKESQSFYYWGIEKGHDINGQVFWHHKLPAHIEYAKKLFRELFI